MARLGAGHACVTVAPMAPSRIVRPKTLTYHIAMQPRFSFARLVVAFVLALTVLVGPPTQAASAGVADTACAGTDNQSAPLPCPNDDVDCVGGGRCVFGGGAQMVLRSVAASPSVRNEDTCWPVVNPVIASRSTKPDPYPPRPLA